MNRTEAGTPRTWDLLRRFVRGERAAAAVEFALILPFLLSLYLGSIEASSLFTVDRRVTVISSTLGDLVSRAKGTVSMSDLNDYFNAAQGIMVPYPLTGLKQVVTCVSVTTSGVTKVMWSKASGTGAVARTKGASYPLAATTQMNQIARGDAKDGYVIVSETSYSYKPVLAQVFKNPITMYHESMYLPRFGNYITEPS